MMQDVRSIPAAVALASLGLLGGALAFQHVGGLAPCVLCLYQRYPHGATALLAALALVLAIRRPGLAALALGLAGASLLAGAGVAAFHVGVEQHWWEGTSACVGATPATLEELRAQIIGRPVARCDEAAWSLFGISMAGYNLVLSLALAALALAGARRLAAGRSG